VPLLAASSTPAFLVAWAVAPYERSAVSMAEARGRLGLKAQRTHREDRWFSWGHLPTRPICEGDDLCMEEAGQIRQRIGFSDNYASALAFVNALIRKQTPGRT
jgi:hypothetical protein